MKKYGEGITTGFEAIDKYFKFLPTNLYMFSAATHVGKTNLLLNMAGRMARAGNKVIIASLEQNVFVIPRIAGMFKSREGMENISFIAPDMMPTPEDFVKVMEKNKDEKKVLMIDHLHFFARGNRGATEGMDELVASIQMVAKKLQIPVVVVAHLRKLNKDNKPTLDDLKDSSSLAQIPGVVCLMHRDFNKEEDIEQKGVGYFSSHGTLFIAKNRVQGNTGLEKFEIADNGEIVFDRYPNDIINKKAEITSNAGKNGWDGFFTD
jgi:replicative DNA helicase